MSNSKPNKHQFNKNNSGKNNQGNGKFNNFKSNNNQKPVNQPKLPLVYVEGMTAVDIAEVTKRPVNEIIKSLMMLGILANQTQSIDRDTA